MTDNVVDFGGLSKLDLDPDRLLKKAIGRMDQVVIIGYDKDGEEYFATSQADGGETLWHLQRAIHRLMNIADKMAND